MSSAPTNPREQSASNSVTEERDDGTPADGDRAVEGQSADSSDLTADPASAQSASSDLPAGITKDVAHDAGTSTGVGGDQPQLDSVANDAVLLREPRATVLAISSRLNRELMNRRLSRDDSGVSRV